MSGPAVGCCRLTRSRYHCCRRELPRQPLQVSSQLLGGSCDKRLTILQAGDLQPSFGCPSTYWCMQLHTQAPKLAAGTVEQRPRSSLLHMAAKDSGLVLGSPPARVKSRELQARLSKLQQQLDKRQYDQMTADVTQQACSPLFVPVAGAEKPRLSASALTSFRPPTEHACTGTVGKGQSRARASLL